MAATLTTGAVSVATTATQIKAQNLNRTSIVVQNLGPNVVYLGLVGVTTSTGLQLAVDDSVGDIEFTGAIYGIAESGTSDVRFWEEAT